MNYELIVNRTDSKDRDFLNLVKQLNKYLDEQYGLLQEYYSRFNNIDNIQHAIVAYLHDQPAGCGCFKKIDESTVELKRMFVSGKARRNGIGSVILQELEKWASELGYHTMILEHGNNQPEATLLYQKQGYRLIPNYGPYIGLEKTSICMQKILGR